MAQGRTQLGQRVMSCEGGTVAQDIKDSEAALTKGIEAGNEEIRGEARKLLEKVVQLPATRRQVLIGAVLGASALGLASCVPGFGTPTPTPGPDGISYAAGTDISAENRLGLRALWDAIVPGDWLGVEEDDGAPGADQAFVEAWLEQVAVDKTKPVSWLTADFLNLWGGDVNAWAAVTTLFKKDFAQLPLGTSIIDPPTRQGKVILMMNLLVPGIETIFDLQYLGAIMLSKLAFYGDFWFEANDPTVRVGRKYIHMPLPPGTTKYKPNSYYKEMGMPDPRLVVVNGFINLP